MPDATEARLGRSERFKIVLIYLGLGPPVGALISTVILSALAGLTAETLQDALTVSLLPIAALPIALPLSYLLGGLQALAVGAILYFVADEEGKFSYASSAGAALLIAGVTGAALSANSIKTGVALGAVSIGASIALRYFFRNRFGRETAPSAPD